jgi:hypothetical protein
MVDAQFTAHAHLVAAATGRLSTLPQHPMSALRITFLVVLVLFFCGLFIGSYIWMRRPNFGQLEGGRGMAKAHGAAARGAQSLQGTTGSGIKTVPSDRPALR